VDEFDRIGRAPLVDIASGADGVEGAADGLLAILGFLALSRRLALPL
jgi:hypothetical protein